MAWRYELYRDQNPEAIIDRAAASWKGLTKYMTNDSNAVLSSAVLRLSSTPAKSTPSLEQILFKPDSKPVYDVISNGMRLLYWSRMGSPHEWVPSLELS